MDDILVSERVIEMADRLQDILTEEALETVWTFLEHEVESGTLTWDDTEMIIARVKGRITARQMRDEHHQWIRDREEQNS